MQGKVMSGHSAPPDVDVGIDVCKAWLDIHILAANTVLRVANTNTGLKKLIAAAAAGKPKQVARAAVLRKLIILANWRLKADRLWPPEAPIAGPLFAGPRSQTLSPCR